MLTINPQKIPTSELHGWLLSSVAPRPIALASTLDSRGNPNLSPFSFFNVFSARPPILIFSPARRVRDNTVKHTLENVRESGEVVINVVTYDMVHQTSLASTEYERGVNEFLKAGFTMLPSEVVRPFRVAESPVQFECRVKEIRELGSEGGAGNLVICEVLRIHVEDRVLDGQGKIDQRKLDLVARAGGNFYSRAGIGFFEIPKPLTSRGIGVDAMPEAIRNSKVLTGNELGMLGNVEKLPDRSDVDKFIKDYPELMRAGLDEKHKFAQSFLHREDVESAWKALLS